MKLLVLCLSLVATSLAALPPYIPTCSVAEDNIGGCFVKKANEALKTLVSGDKELQTPAVRPSLQHPGVVYKLGDEFIFQMKDTIVTGLDTIQLTDAKVNFDERIIFFQFQFGQVDWNGAYVAKALKSKEEVSDKAHIVYLNNKYELTLNYTIENKHMVVQRISITDLGTPNVDFQFTNIEKHPEIQDLWARSREGFIRSGTDALEQFMTAIFGAIFKAATFDEIFPPK